MTDKLIRLNDVLERFPVAKSTWYQGIRAGIYPAPRKLGRSSAWLERDIQQLIERTSTATPQTECEQ